MSKRALLINPPVYDVQYWAEWSQPHGLLKVGQYLKTKGYETRLIDCLYPDAKRSVRKKLRSVVEVGSATPEVAFRKFRKTQGKLARNQRLKFVFGTNLDDMRQELYDLGGFVGIPTSRGPAWTPTFFPENTFVPDEIWITSIMTYWWESTVNVAELCHEVFPSARIRIGGIYPTLASDHLQTKLADCGMAFGTVLGCDLDLDDERNLIVIGEIPEASWLDLDLDLYFEPHLPDSRYFHTSSQSGLGDPTDRRNYGPPYAILTTTRGCPFDCAYCAQRAYNLYDNPRVRQELWTNERGRKKAVRTRGIEQTLDEIRDKFHRYGIRQFAFYEDNFLMEREHFRAILEGIIADPDLRGNLHLHAPEGIEIRLIDGSLAKLMREAGFERVYLPLENINTDVTKSWNRSHSNVQMFERAVENCIEAGFALRNMQVNAFLLFGTPGENIRDVVDSVIFASSRIGSVIPMLFTPVPGSALYLEYQGYLRDEMGFDLQHLSGKLLPFLEFNRRFYPEMTVQDYQELEALMFRVNAQAVPGTFDIGGGGRVSTTFREALRGTTQT